MHRHQLGLASLLAVALLAGVWVLIGRTGGDVLGAARASQRGIGPGGKSGLLEGPGEKTGVTSHEEDQEREGVRVLQFKRLAF